MRSKPNELWGGLSGDRFDRSPKAGRKMVAQHEAVEVKIARTLTHVHTHTHAYAQPMEEKRRPAVLPGFFVTNCRHVPVSNLHRNFFFFSVPPPLSPSTLPIFTFFPFFINLLCVCAPKTNQHYPPRVTVCCPCIPTNAVNTAATAPELNRLHPPDRHPTYRPDVPGPLLWTLPTPEL